MTANVLAALGPRNAALMANHGAIALGKSMQEAFTTCQLLEKTAQIYVFALALRNVTLLPADAAEVEKAFFNAVYGEG
jgi:L-fuculose-phosphate aldolase